MYLIKNYNFFIILSKYMEFNIEFPSAILYLKRPEIFAQLLTRNPKKNCR